MAEEAVKFPGTDLSLVEIFEKSWRLDHPNFGDVHRTTYVKGVITEFKSISDNPIEAESLVKVEIEGIGESDFLPLFFHPKTQYWDGADVQAQDLDTEKGYFKQAFMSFRSGDEVIVMLKEGVPVGVIEFADKVPRIGENILKISWEKWNGQPHFAHIQAAAMPDVPIRPDGSNAWSEYGILDTEPKGPDGLDLGLVEAYKLCETEIDSHYVENPSVPEGTGQTTYYKYHEYLIRLGGKVYIIQFDTHWTYNETWYFGWDGEQWYKGEYSRPPYWGYGSPGFSILGAIDKNGLVKDAISLGVQHSALSSYLIVLGTYADPGFHYYLPYPGFTYQPDCCLGLLYEENSFRDEMFPGFWQGTDVINGTTMKVYARPHTQAELEAAGMWPPPPQ